MTNISWFIPLSVRTDNSGKTSPPKKKWDETTRHAVRRDRAENIDYYKKNKRFIHLANEGKYVAIHKNGRGTIISASDTKKERRRYLKSLDETIRQGAYVPVEKLEEFREEPEDYVI